jgi:superfamily I DNA/RNA helicase
VIFDALNPEQCRAVETTRGPVCILAGAGSGKTTTIIMRLIANQIATGAFSPSQILAVTFADKAANEMRERLARFGVTGVPARTFYAAALAQLHFFAPGRVGGILPSKALVLKPTASSLPRPPSGSARWLGERDDVCVVGDDYQLIYAFTGATPRYLLGMPGRFPDATAIRLQPNS